jgi:hypothetical protein
MTARTAGLLRKSLKSDSQWQPMAVQNDGAARGQATCLECAVERNGAPESVWALACGPRGCRPHNPYRSL